MTASGEEGAVKHGSWGRAADFFVTMLGFAVGLGNVWRFPNVVYKYGGGAFFIPYILAIVLIGYPLFLLESSIGQYSRKNAIEVWDVSPIARGVGVAAVFSISMINIYYTTPQAWALYYLATSMTEVLPWADCNHEWVSPTCNGTSAEDYFYNKVVKVSSGLTEWGDFNWELVLCNLAVWVIIFAGVCYGAASLGKVAYFTSTFPYLMLTAMLIFTLLLDDAYKGIDYYLYPDPEKLNDIRVWSTAVSQVFFSTGLGCGVVAQMSSYNKFNHNLLRDSVLVPSSDALTSFFAGFSVFAVLGYMSGVKGVTVPEVVNSGPGLIFITYPEAFLKMPGGNVWAVFFFFMVIILGLSSSIPSVECVCSVVGDFVPWFKKTRLRNIMLRAMLCLLQFSLGIFFFFENGFYSYSLIDDRVIGYALMIIGIAETLAIGYFYGPKRLIGNVTEMVGGWQRLRFLQYYFMASWLVIAPAGILFIFIYDVATYSGFKVLDYVYPDWAVAIGWALVAIAPLLIVVIAFITLCDCYKAYKLLWRATQPNKEWKRRDDADDVLPPSIESAPTGPQSLPPGYVPYNAYPAPTAYQGQTNVAYTADPPQFSGASKVEH